MEFFLNRPLLPYICVLVLWIVACYLQSQMTIFNFVAGVSLVYFPAGIRTLSVFIFGFKGAVAIFFGSLLTMLFEFPSLQPTPSEILWASGVAAASAFSAYIAMKAVKSWQRIPTSLEGLTMQHVVYIVITQGIVSATLHQLLFQSSGAAEAYVDETTLQALVYWAAMASGDIVGSMLVLLTVLIVYQLLSETKKTG